MCVWFRQIISDPAGEFAAIDADGSGYLRFDEFASWALSKKLDLEDDDDPDNVRRGGHTHIRGAHTRLTHGTVPRALPTLQLLGRALDV